jgi:ligand-binding sensor protein
MAFTVPLIIVNGPLVREDVMTAVVRLQKNSKNEQTIFITDMWETNNEYED